MRPSSFKASVIFAAVYFAIGMDSCLFAQSSPSEALPVRSELGHLDGKYRENDTLRVSVESDVDAFVYVLYRQAGGEVLVLFPNRIDKDSRFTPHMRKVLPSSDQLEDSRRTMRIRIVPPFGEDAVQVLSSYRRIEELERAVEDSKQGAPQLSGEAVDELVKHYDARNAMIARETHELEIPKRSTAK